MPCRDYYDDHPEAYFRDVTEPGLKAQISFAESALCASLGALEAISKHARATTDTKLPRDFYDWIDFAEAGITKEALVSWHRKHVETDQLHRKQAADKLKAQARAKLTDEEAKALGIK